MNRKPDIRLNAGDDGDMAPYVRRVWTGQDDLIVATEADAPRPPAYVQVRNDGAEEWWIELELQQQFTNYEINGVVVEHYKVTLLSDDFMIAGGELQRVHDPYGLGEPAGHGERVIVTERPTEK